MPVLRPFISKSYRPNLTGGRLDKNHRAHCVITTIDHQKPIPICHPNAICFGPKNDRVLLNLEYALTESDNTLVFYYEDMHQRWSYVCDNNDYYFIYKKNHSCLLLVKPQRLYIRGCQLEPSDPMWQELGYFYCFVDLWPGDVICAPHKQLTNESKLFQLNNSLKRSAHHHPKISIGHSYVIKGIQLKPFMDKKHNYVVKSLSGIRSIVVDSAHYAQWNQQNMNHLPVLFQKKIAGCDLRVHIICGQLFAKQAMTKQQVDYRYDPAFAAMLDYPIPNKQLTSFCRHVAAEEQNCLIGLDFIKHKTRYTVLEANPSPGWSAYHECYGMENPAFVKALIKVLTHGTNP